MKQSLLAACVLLAACSGVRIDEPAADTITPLEQACLRDPFDPATWEALAAALAVAGQRERAATMYRQAASLRAHDVRQDYATLRQAREEANEDDMPRTQVRRLGPALVEVLRTPARSTARLEISNGNGLAGAAARLARSLETDGVKTVRLSNLRPFGVTLSRIEYRYEQKEMALALGRRLNLPLRRREGGTAYADLRIVLGRDVRYLK